MSAISTHETKQAFLSYAWRDREFAEEISSLLHAEHVSVIDPADAVRVGNVWSDDVIAALKAADFVVFVTPKFSEESSLTLAELGAAKALGKPIVPVMQNAGWHATSGIANVVSGHLALDASRIKGRDLANAILSLGRPKQKAVG